MELLKRHKTFNGWTEYYTHQSSSTRTAMRFAIFLPAQSAERRLPVLYFLSGLTCSEENFISKSGVQRYAAEQNLIVVAPDTSPRGAGIAGEDASWDFGTGASFYVNATEAKWREHYQMYDYIQTELPALIAANFPTHPELRGIMGHSMGGHGALVIALREPRRWHSVSALAPICAPSEAPWGRRAFTGYLGPNEATWTEYDASQLVVRSLPLRRPILVDQGSQDEFLLAGQLRPERLRQACEATRHPLTLRMQEGYDHSYYFVSTFIGDHIVHHAQALSQDLA